MLIGANDRILAYLTFVSVGIKLCKAAREGVVSQDGIWVITIKRILGVVGHNGVKPTGLANLRVELTITNTSLKKLMFVVLLLPWLPYKETKKKRIERILNQ